MPKTILRVDSGADHAGSISRRLADDLIRGFAADDDVIIRRDASAGLPIVNGDWVAAAFADGDPAHLDLSEELIAELLACDELVLVAPIYNLSIPAAMKAWIDQVVRAGRTFRYSEYGPHGLVGHIERAWIVTCSGSTPIGSEYDFNTPYLKAILGFIGVTNVRVVTPSPDSNETRLRPVVI
jgi:FMN-dependent NADH-azoreductase